jgi:hypothetical protein
MAITDQKLENWARKHDLKKLHKALLEYDYKVRLKAATHLARLQNRESLPHLERLVDDPFPAVLQAAARAIGTISPGHPSIAVFEQKIEQKEGLEARRKARTEASFVPLTEEEEREKLERMAKESDIMKVYQTGLREAGKRKQSWWLAVSIAVGAGTIATLLYYLIYVI